MYPSFDIISAQKAGRHLRQWAPYLLRRNLPVLSVSVEVIVCKPRHLATVQTNSKIKSSHHSEGSVARAEAPEALCGSSEALRMLTGIVPEHSRLENKNFQWRLPRFALHDTRRVDVMPRGNRSVLADYYPMIVGIFPASDKTSNTARTGGQTGII